MPDIQEVLDNNGVRQGKFFHRSDLLTADYSGTAAELNQALLSAEHNPSSLNGFDYQIKCQDGMFYLKFDEAKGFHLGKLPWEKADTDSAPPTTNATVH